MPQGEVRVGVPTKDIRGKRLTFGLRDVLITLGIALFIAGVLFAYNYLFAPAGREGSFVLVNPYTGGLPAGPAPTLGAPAPDFQLSLLGGGTFKLSENRGRPVWVFFWATWCPPCRAEMPDIEKIWREEKGNDLVIMAVDFAETTDTVQAFTKKLGLTFPIGMDFYGRTMTEYRITGFPSHFFIDKEGILREIRIGSMNEATMREKIKKLRSY